MTKLLSEAAVAQYRRDGVYFPIDVLSRAEAEACLNKLEAVESREGGQLSRGTNQKPHLLLTWLNDLIRHPKILDAVEDTLGPNILCWASGFFAKKAHDPGYISWHQDSTYWGLSSPDVATAWVAFTPSTVESGCMRVIPGSHLKDQLPHDDTFADDNMLSRGQEIQVEVDERQALDVVLEPGQASLHHVRLIHGSEPNRADHRRVGYAIRYIPTYVRQLSELGDSATLVRGVDEYDHFELEPAPEADFHPDAVAYHASLLERQTKILYADAEKVKAFAKAASAR